LPYALSSAASLLKLGSSVTAQTLFFRASHTAGSPSRRSED
jgi:hypothetical protein